MKDLTGIAVHTETRRLAAIMFTDIVGFSRQMGSDEARMLRLLDVHNQIIQQAVVEHHGMVIKTVGDAFLVDFPSVVHAVQCAQQIQTQFRAHNAGKEAAEQIHVRIGVHSGDIVQRDGDVFGDGVNIASRLQALAEPDTIYISDMVYRDVVKKLNLGTVVSFGKPKLKNIAERFTVYALLPETSKGVRRVLQIQWLKASRRVRPTHRAAVAGLLLIAATVVAVRYLSVLLPSPQPLAPSTQAALPLPDKPSIVVLPFVNMSEDPKQEYFSDGLTEDLTFALSKISSLFVIARNSAFTYKGKAVKVQDVSKELGVRYVLEGSVRRADNQVRITAQLIDATTGGHLWSERYDRPLQDIFALQDDVVQKIVTTLKLQLTVQEQGILVRKTTDNLAAYDYYLRGRAHFNRFTQEATAQARQMFEQVLELDPQYAEAYAFLCWTYFAEWALQWSQDSQALDQALALAQKAVALDDSLAQAHATLGVVYLWKKQYALAIAEEERAIALDANFADAYRWLGDILKFAGRPEEAMGLIEQAMRLNPHYPPFYLFFLGEAYRSTGRYEEAMAAYKKALTRNPDYSPAHVGLAAIYSELGREEEARAEAAEVLKINPQYSLERWRQIWPYKDPAVLERLIAALRKAGLK
jgi:adenylate cyclase